MMVITLTECLLYARDPEAGALLAEAYIGMGKYQYIICILNIDLIRQCIDEEIRGVRVLHDALLKRPSSYALLHVQVDFLRSKASHHYYHHICITYQDDIRVNLI
jgi:hypothetical protein